MKHLANILDSMDFQTFYAKGNLSGVESEVKTNKNGLPFILIFDEQHNPQFVYFTKTCNQDFHKGQRITREMMKTLTFVLLEYNDKRETRWKITNRF